MVCLLLRGTPVLVMMGKNARTGITGLNTAGSVMRSHGVLWSHAEKSDELLEHALGLMDEGYKNDSAVAATISDFPG